MSKQNVIKNVQDSLDIDATQKDIGAVFNAIFDVLGDLDEEQSCRIRDFGIFKVKLRKERKGSTIGKPAKKITIPARLAMTFKISKKFKMICLQLRPLLQLRRKLLQRRKRLRRRRQLRRRLRSKTELILIDSAGSALTRSLSP